MTLVQAHNVVVAAAVAAFVDPFVVANAGHHGSYTSRLGANHSSSASCSCIQERERKLLSKFHIKMLLIRRVRLLLKHLLYINTSVFLASLLTVYKMEYCSKQQLRSL